MASFTDAVSETADLLRGNDASHSVLNRAASQTNLLGLKLHGLGFVHDREIAACLTAAIDELTACHALPEALRPEAVLRAIRHLEAAASRVETGGLSA
jgi:hypothetical protein